MLIFFSDELHKQVVPGNILFKFRKASKCFIFIIVFATFFGVKVILHQHLANFTTPLPVEKNYKY